MLQSAVSDPVHIDFGASSTVGCFHHPTVVLVGLLFLWRESSNTSSQLPTMLSLQGCFQWQPCLISEPRHGVMLGGPSSPSFAGISLVQHAAIRSMSPLTSPTTNPDPVLGGFTATHLNGQKRAPVTQFRVQLRLPRRLRYTQACQPRRCARISSIVNNGARDSFVGSSSLGTRARHLS